MDADFLLKQPFESAKLNLHLSNNGPSMRAYQGNWLLFRAFPASQTNKPTGYRNNQKETMHKYLIVYALSPCV